MSIARTLVLKSDSPCQRHPGVASVYTWEGRIVEDQETTLLIKTTDDRMEASKRLNALHPYSVPEIVAPDVART
ncbi:MAG: divalent cation tolerance protein CutA [bacterium]